MTKDPFRSDDRLFPFVLFIAILSLLSFGRIWWLHNPIWDDNCWLQIIYSTSTLSEYLDGGSREIRRVPAGIALYPVLSLHKTGPFFYMAWHSIDTITELLTPILLFMLSAALFPGKRLLGCFVAISFIVFHLDHTLGYASSNNYRIGLLLSLYSLYLTKQGVSSNTLHPGCLLGALLASGLACYVYIEVAVAFEPARLLLIGYALPGREGDTRNLARKALLMWCPFFLMSIPLLVYKVIYRPFGIYESAYQAPDSLIRILKILASIFYYEGLEVYSALQYSNSLSLLLGCAATMLCLTVWFSRQGHAPVHLSDGNPSSNPSFTRTLADSVRSERMTIVFGIAFSLPPLLLLLYADRALGGNLNSSHAAFLQIGLSMIMGPILYGISSALGRLRKNARLLGTCALACLVGTGVFINNKYLDLYFQSWASQTEFWNGFTHRFPNLPDHSAVFFDVQDGSVFTNIKIYYDFEFHMNLLYATSTAPDRFHRHRAYTMAEVTLDARAGVNRLQALDPIRRRTHFGFEVLDPRTFIIVRYRPGEFLVNREILDRYPDIEYKAWLDKDFPALPPRVPYILRDKLRQFP